VENSVFFSVFFLPPFNPRLKERSPFSPFFGHGGDPFFFFLFFPPHHEMGREPDVFLLSPLLDAFISPFSPPFPPPPGIRGSTRQTGPSSLFSLLSTYQAKKKKGLSFFSAALCTRQGGVPSFFFSQIQQVEPGLLFWGVLKNVGHLLSPPFSFSGHGDR